MQLHIYIKWANFDRKRIIVYKLDFFQITMRSISKYEQMLNRTGNEFETYDRNHPDFQLDLYIPWPNFDRKRK